MMSIDTKSDSDFTSLDLSSPKRNAYYVQSPSRDSRDEDKSSSSLQATPISSSPMDSPSHPSYGYGRSSSASRVSGNFRDKGRKKGWHECNVVIEEEEKYYDEDELYGIMDQGLSRKCHVFVGVIGFLMMFMVFCFILWAAGTHYKPQIALKRLNVHSFYYGEGSDYSGVPTKMLTMNCSMTMNIHNPATFFGIHITSTIIKLIYSDIVVAIGQLKKYYQPRKSRRSVYVYLQGRRIPLYGAGPSLAGSDGHRPVPLQLLFQVKSQGYVVGKLVKSRHTTHISCTLLLDSTIDKPIYFNKHSCKHH